MDTIIFSQARNKFAALCDKVTDDRAPIEIFRRDKSSVVLMDKSEYEGLMETLYLLSSPKNAARLMESIAELDAGQTVEWTEVKDKAELEVAEAPEGFSGPDLGA